MAIGLSGAVDKYLYWLPWFYCATNANQNHKTGGLFIMIIIVIDGPRSAEPRQQLKSFLSYSING